MMQGDAIRRALSAHERALVKKLVDSEVRRRHESADRRTAETKRRYLAGKA